MRIAPIGSTNKAKSLDNCHIFSTKLFILVKVSSVVPMNIFNRKRTKERGEVLGDGSIRSGNNLILICTVICTVGFTKA